mgnify:FL=1
MSALYDQISFLLSEQGLSCFAPVPLSACKIFRPYLLERAQISPEGTAVMIAVPYIVRDSVPGNLSEYAKSRDYHLFFAELFASILPALQKDFPDYRFAGFTDHSPLDEIHAAARAGLGRIGDHGLLITEPYASFVFLGEIITDAPIPCTPSEIRFCEKCGLCRRCCPTGCDKTGCLSAVTQKKGELTPKEIALIASNGSVWGCDLCQKVCPHAKKVYESGSVYTEIPFFKEKRTPFLTRTLIESMSDKEFSERAFAWRGRQPLLRNLKILGLDQDT